MDGAEDSHRVHKIRLKHLLNEPRLVARLQDAVERMHAISGRALVFGKIAYLSSLDRLLIERGGVFDAHVASKLAQEFPLTPGTIEGWMDVVSTDLDKRRGPPYSAETLAKLRPLHDLYAINASLGVLPATKTGAANLSGPKGASADLLAINYRNNVHCHFDKYVKRFVNFKLTEMARVEAGMASDARLSKAARSAISSDVRAVCNDLLQCHGATSCRQHLQGWVDEHRGALVPPRPPSASGPHWRFKSQEEHPEKWLPYMVMINRLLEAAGCKKLFSPLIQRTSFVPGHVRLDSTSLIDLLVEDSTEMMSLVSILEDTEMQQPPSGGGASSVTELVVKYKLPGMFTGNADRSAERTSKGLLYKKLVDLVDPETRAAVERDPVFHAAAFNTAKWMGLTQLGRNKHAVLTLPHAGLFFNNVIDTDGVSASLHYVSRSMVGLTRFNGGFSKLRAVQKAQTASEKRKGAMYVTSLSSEERGAIIHGGGKEVSCDPGKGVLAAVTDGSGRVVKYTAAQRRAESGEARRALKQRRMSDARICGGASVAELTKRIGGTIAGTEDVASSKSCIPQHYYHYLVVRAELSDQLTEFYRRPVFRQHRYQNHVGRKAADDRFASRIRNAFGDVKIMLYGDWGRRPNLPHQPPSPGVGLRRRLSSHFPVYLVHEAYTSSVCPRCGGGDLQHPRKNRGGQDVHHLLKCPNASCSCHWWHRDVLGSLNILTTGKHALETGGWHPNFSARATTA